MNGIYKVYRIIQRGCAAALIALALFFSFLIVSSYSRKAENDYKTSEALFDDEYVSIENELLSLQRIGNLILGHQDIREFANNQEDAYSQLKVIKQIKFYQDIFNSYNIDAFVTDLESNNCVGSRGMFPMEDMLYEMNLDSASVNAIANKNEIGRTSYILDDEKQLLYLFFSQEYSDQKMHCIIIADILSRGSSDYKKSYTELLDSQNAPSEDAMFVRKSTHINGLSYQYFDAANNDIFKIFTMAGVLGCVLIIIFSKRLSLKIIEAAMRLITLIISWLFTSKCEDLPLDIFIEKLICDDLIQSSIQKNDTAYRRQKHFTELLTGPNEKSADIIKSDSSFEWKNGCCVVLMVCRAKIPNVVVMRLEKKIRKILDGEFVPVSDAEFVFVSANTDTRAISRQFINILDFSDIYRMKMHICVGKKVDDINELYISYTNAREAYERRYGIQESEIFFGENIGDEGRGQCHYPVDLELGLIEATLLGNEADMNIILSELIEKNLYSNVLNSDVVREFKMMIASTVNRIVSQSGKSLASIFGNDTVVYLEIGSSRNINDIEKGIRNTFGTLCSHMKQRDISKKERLADDILEYIGKNFRNPALSLENVAGHFLLSQTHIRRVLMQEKGKGYKEILDEIRIKEAITQLISTEKKIKDIAEDVGYGNVRTFSRVFEKQIKATPNQYRLSMKSNN